MSAAERGRLSTVDTVGQWWLMNLLVGLLAILPPSAAAGEAGNSPQFSHVLHVDEGAECTDCHAGAEEGLPTLNREQCTNCHDEAPGYRAPARAKRLPFPFPHGVHAGAAECGDCHRATAKDEQSTAELMVAPPQCFACHDENGVDAMPTQCVACHGSDLKASRPAFHDASWLADHGARMGGEVPALHGRDCKQCHGGDNPCMSCHEAKKPMYHSRHLEDRGADCMGCHGIASKKRPGFPGVDLESCEDCHDVTPQATHLRSRGRRLDAKFPHAAHVESVQCSECHGATVEDRQAVNAPLVSQAQCVSCHADNGVRVSPSQCARCHGVNRRNTAPEDHGPTWTRLHGMESGRRGEQHGESCETCHARASCAACHKNRAPSSHQGFWRARLHGLVAPWQRERCQTCHETGACVSCHRQNAPLNHRGGWCQRHGLAAITRDNESCRACHAVQWCTACHQGRGCGL